MKGKRYFVQALGGGLAALTVAASLAETPAWPDDPAIPSILTVTRLQQSRAETPASITVLDREFIAASGIRDLPELLRFVPGMSVSRRDGHNPVVSQHGTTYRDNRRMQVLVDGRSVYSSGLANVNWNDLPLTLEDIERIEITRGPNAAAYGANAFLGVVNIITRHPEDTPKLALGARRGHGNNEDYRLHYSGGHETAQWGVTLASRHDDGFDHNRSGAPRRDSSDQRLINARLILEPTDDWSLDLQAGYLSGTNTDDAFDPSMVSFPDMQVSNGFVSAQLEQRLSDQHALQVRAYYNRESLQQDWVSCLPMITLNRDLARLYLSNPNYAAALLDGQNPIGSGGSGQDDALAAAVLTDYFSLGGPASGNTCGRANQDTVQTRYDLEIQDTLAIGERLRLVTGLNLRRDVQESATYLNGKVERDSLRLFLHSEYRLGERWLLNLGGLYEDESGTPASFAPRMAINVHLTPGQTLRAVYSTAYRNPDILETDASWAYTLHGLSRPYHGSHSGQYFPRALGRSKLDNEEIVSQEIGYFGDFRTLGLQIDLRLFNNRLKNLISQNIALADFQPNNDARVRISGVETEIQYRPSHRWLLRLSHAYLRTDFPIRYWREIQFTPRYAGSLFVLWKLPQDWQLSASYYYADNINEKHYSRGDLRLAKTWRIGQAELEVAGIVQRRFDDEGELFSDNLHDRNSRLFLQTELRF